MSVPGATYTFTVDALGNDEVAYARSYCNQIILGENAQAGTVDWKFRFTSGGDQVTVPAGGTWTFRSSYAPGDFVAFVSTVSGSMTMAQVEQIVPA